MKRREIGAFGFVNPTSEALVPTSVAGSFAPALVILSPLITASGDSHHCFGVPIAAIKMLVDAAFRQRARNYWQRVNQGRRRIGALNSRGFANPVIPL
jgi:hypothetical protein